MNSLYHLRIDVRRIQDYIFQVPRLKFMLGANSKIGELFGKELPNFIGKPECLFGGRAEQYVLEPEMAALLKQNVICSSGGHFEAVFAEQNSLMEFFATFIQHLGRELPDLEWSASYRQFDPSAYYADFEKIDPLPLSSADSAVFPDSPFYQLCANDGVSIALEYDKAKKVPVGSKHILMQEQAERFYKIQSVDAIAKFYLDMGIIGNRLADELEDLAKQGHSLKNNMLAYIKIDGNGTGERFRALRETIRQKPTLEAFIEIEMFWAQNRKYLRSALKDVLLGDLIAKHQSPKLPYLLLMLGGDDLFLVCIPELAMDIASKMAGTLETTCPISAGIAYTKTNYSIGLSRRLAESCLESAKSASYREDPGKKPPYIDWHIHFDSVYQEIRDIRRNSYMLEYTKDGKRVVELLSQRPYPYREAASIIKEVRHVAGQLDDADGEMANNKIKSYRSVLKNGYKEVEYFREMLLGTEDKLVEFLQRHSEIKTTEDEDLKLNSALDKIELLEFYRSIKVKKEKA